MTKLRLYIMCGLAFSGKSTLARKLVEHTGSKFIAFDKLWVEKDKEKPVPKNSEGWRYIRDVAQKEILNSLKSGSSVVYDDNNPRKEHREELKKVAREAGAEAVVVYLDTPLSVVRNREEANRTSKERHDVEIPTADENVVVFTPEISIDEFLKTLNY